MAITPKYNDVNKLFPDRAYQDPLAPSRETRTRSELLRESGPPTDIKAPEDQDMWDDGEEPPSTKKSTKRSTKKRPYLPPVETIYPIKQSTGSKRGVKRPDKNKDFYNRAVVRQSTRVWGLQWIPTRISEADTETANVYGDILAAFARPSNVQATSVYIYPDQEQKSWETLKNGTSFGRGINNLNGGRPYTSADGSKHVSLHPTESGLFAEDLGELNAGRPGNESKTYAEVLARADITASGRKSKKEAARLSKLGRAQQRERRRAESRVISGPEEIAADLQRLLFGDKE